MNLIVKNAVAEIINQRGISYAHCGSGSDTDREFVQEAPRTEIKIRMKTISQYAALCGVSHQAIHDRIRRGILKAEAKTDVTNRKILMIDAKKYPPRKLKAGRPKTKTK